MTKDIKESTIKFFYETFFNDEILKAVATDEEEKFATTTTAAKN